MNNVNFADALHQSLNQFHIILALVTSQEVRTTVKKQFQVSFLFQLSFLGNSVNFVIFVCGPAKTAH